MFSMTPDDRVLQKTPYFVRRVGMGVLLAVCSPTGRRLVVAPAGAERDSAHIARRSSTTGSRCAISCRRRWPRSSPSPPPAIPRRCGWWCVPARFLLAEVLVQAGRVFPAASAPARTLSTTCTGPTEAAVDITWWYPGDDWDRTSVPIGLPVHNSAVYVLDDALRPPPRLRR